MQVYLVSSAEKLSSRRCVRGIVHYVLAWAKCVCTGSTISDISIGILTGFLQDGLIFINYIAWDTIDKQHQKISQG